MIWELKVGVRNGKIRLGISSCLLGNKVRYDGGHQLDAFLKDNLGKHVEFIPVCPEVECGLGVPRKIMRLEGNSSFPRLIVADTGDDLTDRMEQFARHRIAQLKKKKLCGFVFKSNSPSCGIDRVKVFIENIESPETATGIFARIFMDSFPALAVEDEKRLRDRLLYKKFIEKIFTDAK